MIITTIISLLLYVRTGRNVSSNQRKAIMNILGIETSHFEKNNSRHLDGNRNSININYIIKGNKANKMVFHLYGVIAVINFVNSLYLLYFSKA